MDKKKYNLHVAFVII